MFPFQCEYFVHKYTQRYVSTMRHVGHGIPLLRRPRPTQGYRADDDDSDYCKQVVGKNH